MMFSYKFVLCVGVLVVWLVWGVGVGCGVVCLIGCVGGGGGGGTHTMKYLYL